jgi:calcineurin-like phosphoesterase family protein
MGNIWFTADSHFGHANIIKYCGRPFANKFEHDETIIQNWNSVVQKGDTIYHLGDFGFGSSQWLMDKIAGKLKGKICLVKGNHDRTVNKEPLCRRFEFIKDVHMLHNQTGGKKYMFWLSHYAHLSWPQANYGVIHLYGHSHGRLQGVGKSMDVGVDTNNFFPYSLETIVQIMEEKAANVPIKIVSDEERWRPKTPEEKHRAIEKLIEEEGNE